MVIYLINVLFEKESLYHSSKIEIEGLRIKARFDDYEYFKTQILALTKIDLNAYKEDFKLSKYS